MMWRSGGTVQDWPSFPLNSLQNYQGANGFWAQLLNQVSVTTSNGATATGWTWQAVQPVSGGGWNPYQLQITGWQASSPAFESMPPGVATAITSIVAGGTGYAVGDTIMLAGGVSTTDYSNPTILKVASVASGAVSSVYILVAGTYLTTPTNPVAQASSSGSGTGASFDLTYSVPGTGGTAKSGDVVWLRPGAYNVFPSAPAGLEYVFDPVARSLSVAQGVWVYDITNETNFFFNQTLEFQYATLFSDLSPPDGLPTRAVKIIPNFASLVEEGIVSIGTQSFNGDKTFNYSVEIDGASPTSPRGTLFVGEKTGFGQTGPPTEVQFGTNDTNGFQNLFYLNCFLTPGDIAYCDFHIGVVNNTQAGGHSSTAEIFGPLTNYSGIQILSSSTTGSGIRAGTNYRGGYSVGIYPNPPMIQNDGPNVWDGSWISACGGLNTTQAPALQFNDGSLPVGPIQRPLGMVLWDINADIDSGAPWPCYGVGRRSGGGMGTGALYGKSTTQINGDVYTGGILTTVGSAGYTGNIVVGGQTLHFFNGTLSFVS